MGLIVNAALTVALFWPEGLCFLAAVHGTLLLETANWQIISTADLTRVNGNVWQRMMQGGKVCWGKMQSIY